MNQDHCQGQAIEPTPQDGHAGRHAQSSFPRADRYGRHRRLTVRQMIDWACRALLGTLPWRCRVAITLVALWTPDPTWALVIYRFGGEDLPPPTEVDGPGVRFVQQGWEQVAEDAGGRTFDVEVGRERIAALKRDPNVNIAPSVEDEGGIHWHVGWTGAVWDGDEGTAWTAEPYQCATTLGYNQSCVDEFGSLGAASIIFGTPRRIDRIRLISGLADPGRIVQSLRVSTSLELPRLPVVRGNPIQPQTTWVVEVHDNREQVLEVPLPPSGESRFLQVVLQEHVTPWDVHEIEIYAKGYVRHSTYVSNVVDLGRPMAVGELRWSGSRGERAVVQIQTRSGLDDDPVRHWRSTGRGQEKVEVSRSAYADLGIGERAGTRDDQQNWSTWSSYPFADSLGVPVASPSPRRYFQIRVDFLPQDDDGGQLRHLEFSASPPMATALVGEVWPVEARTGEVTTFTYVLRPTIAVDDPGFDRLELQSQAVLGTVHGLWVADESVPNPVVVADSHRVVLRLPRLGAADSGAPVEVVFEARVLRYGDRFEARVWDSAQPQEVRQGVVAGDATGDHEGNRVSVATSLVQSSLLALRVSPGVVTPNGDGVNDVARLEYDILEVTGQASVRAEVWDLAGRRVRLLLVGAQGAGQYRRSWDGRDGAGRLVPPGIYLIRVVVETDAKHIERTRVLHVVY